VALMARSPDSQRQRMFSGHENAPSFLTFLIAIHLATAVVLFAFVLRDWIEIFKGPGAFGPCPQNQSVRHLRQTRVAPRRGHRSRWHPGPGPGKAHPCLFASPLAGRLSPKAISAVLLPGMRLSVLMCDVSRKIGTAECH